MHPSPTSPLPSFLPSRFSALGKAFFTATPTTPLPEPYLVDLNPAVAQSLQGLHAEHPDFVLRYSGSYAPDQASSLATVYSGHQFGVWAGQLGDGRALLLGELDSTAGRQEVQLKGAGKTPYSRMGDGRAVLRSTIREYLCSAAMEGLGIPTTQALCMTGSDALVMRETPETAAVVTRIAPSFIRFGHFEHFASRNMLAELRQLADFVIAEFYPDSQTAANPYAALLEAVALRTADLMAHWQAVGFCHGVMNTDNMSILGLTIDYGPFGFLDGFDANHICNHSDHQGRYAWSAQPQIAYWNLHCLAQALLPLIESVNTHEEKESHLETARAALAPYRERFQSQFLTRFRAKLGLAQAQEGDHDLLQGLFDILQSSRMDFTYFFRNLADFSSTSDAHHPLRDFFADRASWDAWATRYRERLQAEGSVDAERALAMRRVNPKYVLRNHLAEVAIRQAQAKDFSEIVRLRECLAKPFDEQPEFASYAALPPDWAETLSVSCSS